MQQLRDDSIDPSALPKPIYYAWNDDDDHNNEKSFQISISALLGAGADTVRPESLKSVKNFVVVGETTIDQTLHLSRGLLLQRTD